MKKIVMLFVFFTLLVSGTASADDIVFSVNQSEYFFLTGQQAIIPLTMNNTYDEDINGVLSYTITQTISQGGGQYSSSNSQSQSFSVSKGNNTIQINFGSSNQPMTLDADLEFSYNNDDEDRIISLNNIIIHFVSNQSQMNNKQNPKQSSSKKIKNAEPSQQDQQQPQTPQQKLQNNQMNQDSQALKDQIQQQMAKEQAQQKAFEQNLFNNSDFQKQHQQLQNQGYNISQKQLNAESNDTGSFNLSYENKEGETASFQGAMDEGELTDFQKQTAEDRQQMRDTLNQSKKFQEYDRRLHDEGFNQTDISFSQQGNKTTMDLTYTNEKNETATITAEFFDDQLEKVELSKQDHFHPLLWIIPIICVLIAILLFVYYRYYRKVDGLDVSEKKVMKRPFDYKTEAARLLAEAERLYKKGDYKLAYGKAGQSLRLYLSYEQGLKKEITNDDILRFLRNKQYPYAEIKDCFTLCSLVEFAKHKTNTSDFQRVYSTIKSIIARA